MHKRERGERKQKYGVQTEGWLQLLHNQIHGESATHLGRVRELGQHQPAGRPLATSRRIGSRASWHDVTRHGHGRTASHTKYSYFVQRAPMGLPRAPLWRPAATRYVVIPWCGDPAWIWIRRALSGAFYCVKGAAPARNHDHPTILEVVPPTVKVGCLLARLLARSGATETGAARETRSTRNGSKLGHGQLRRMTKWLMRDQSDTRRPILEGQHVSRRTATGCDRPRRKGEKKIQGASRSAFLTCESGVGRQRCAPVGPDRRQKPAPCRETHGDDMTGKIVPADERESRGLPPRAADLQEQFYPSSQGG